MAKSVVLKRFSSRMRPTAVAIQAPERARTDRADLKGAKRAEHKLPEIILQGAFAKAV